MKKVYTLEREGQMDFFKLFDIDVAGKDILIENTDGVDGGILFEFKLDFKTTLNSAILQAIKYLSRMRIKGESVPSKFLIVYLNETTCFVFNSMDFFNEIHQVYYGAASKDNEAFSSDSKYIEKLDYSDMLETSKLKAILRDNQNNPKYLKIDIDENCICGWAERYYREIKNASKGDFLGDSDETGQVKVIGEIRDPKHFKDFINPYKKETNEKFKYLMDRLNDKLQKKDLGAFYTPIPYCQKAAELVREAIKKVPKGNDYVIIDRCAGTGNLESVLTDEELSHCILSTYEYYEYKVLLERLNSKVREIIPPTENQVEYSSGCILNADAMSKAFIENPIIKQYLENENCTIILYENPPYSASMTVELSKVDKKHQSSWQNSYVANEFKNHSDKGTKELADLFIWSGFNYYLRQPTDSYIVFSPIKYWKTDLVGQYKFNSGFMFNKYNFHANSKSAIICAFWENIVSPCDEIVMNAFDIKKSDNQDIIEEIQSNIKIKKVRRYISDFYDDRTFDNDKHSELYCETNGYLAERSSNNALSNDNILASLVVKGGAFGNPRLTTMLTRLKLYDGSGFYLRKDNFILKLPLFVAGKYPIEDKWYENGVLYKSADGGNDFESDTDFLLKCLIFTCLSYYNKCISFKSADGTIYQNELCFDLNTLAKEVLDKYTLNEDEIKLLGVWDRVLQEAKKTDNYNPCFKYGIYQIEKELNESKTVIKNGKEKKVPKYQELNSELTSLKKQLKTYYNNYISEKLFKYELIK